ncbi:MAG: stage II sporulation protein M [Nitrosopumilus sp.]
MNKIRIITFFIFLGIFAGAFQIGSMSSVSEEEADAFMSEFEDLVLDIDAFGIFVHNITIALPMFIPGFGVAWGIFAAWSTGFAFAAIASTVPEIADIPPLSILFLSPFGLIEVFAYSLGISRSFILIRAISKKINLTPFIKPTVIEIGIVLVLLLVGGYLEFYMIDLAQQEGLEMSGSKLLT